MNLKYITLLPFAIVFGGCGSEHALDAQPKVQPSVEVEVIGAQVQTLQPILELVGQTVAIPEKTAVISPQLGGWGQRVDVVEGQQVKAGDLLVELDPRSAQVAVEKAQATVAEKTAALQRLKSGYLPEEIAGAKQDAENAAANVEGLKNELRALKSLLDRNEISPVLYQTKLEASKSAEAVLASANEKVKLLQAGTRPELVNEGKALLDAASADLAQAKLTLDWCSIVSPIDGMVVQLMARRGQFFDRAVSLATVMDLSEVFVQIRIPNRQFAQIHEGLQLSATLASLPNRQFRGEVCRISGQADPMTGNVVVFGKLKNDEKLLRPGLSCQVEILLPAINEALVVPVAAVADRAGTSVVTLIRDQKAYETEVSLGVETSKQVQILSGLNSGDQVAVKGGYGLPEGCPVSISNSRQ